MDLLQNIKLLVPRKNPACAPVLYLHILTEKLNPSVFFTLLNRQLFLFPIPCVCFALCDPFIYRFANPYRQKNFHQSISLPQLNKQVGVFLKTIFILNVNIVVLFSLINKKCIRYGTVLQMFESYPHIMESKTNFLPFCKKLRSLLI